MSKQDTFEYTLNTQQCAKVALYMYKQWQEAMKPPLLVYKDFPQWLEDLLDDAGRAKINKSTQKET